VRPVEIARKLAREMDEHQNETLSHTYVPNEYRVYLSPRDRERFSSYEDALADELAAYLLEYARRERFALLARPVIEFETDGRLGLGEFGIETGVVQAREQEPIGARIPDLDGDPGLDLEPPASGPAAGGTMVFSAARRSAESGQAAVRVQRALVLYDGRRLVIGSSGATLGRSRECDVVVHDANVSRRHAELRLAAGGWVITDLGSTNGTRVNGRQIRGSETLRAGDEIELGGSVMTFELE
jgi:hypothetical protein